MLSSWRSSHCPTNPTIRCHALANPAHLDQCRSCHLRGGCTWAAKWGCELAQLVTCEIRPRGFEYERCRPPEDAQTERLKEPCSGAPAARVQDLRGSRRQQPRRKGASDQAHGLERQHAQAFRVFRGSGWE